MLNRVRDSIQNSKKNKLLEYFPLACIIPRCNIDKKEELGKGAFGIVYAGDYTDSSGIVHKDVAIKEQPISKDKDELEELSNEVYLMRIASLCKQTPDLIDVVLDMEEHRMYIIMQRIKGISLKDFIEDKSKQYGDLKNYWTFLTIAKQLVHGLDCIHKT